MISVSIPFKVELKSALLSKEGSRKKDIDNICGTVSTFITVKKTNPQSSYILCSGMSRDKINTAEKLLNIAIFKAGSARQSLPTKKLQVLDLCQQKLDLETFYQENFLMSKL